MGKITDPNLVAFSEKTQVDNGEINKHNYCQSLIERCYRLEDILYAQYKFEEGFTDNDQKFYDKYHWLDDNTPGYQLNNFIKFFEELSKEKYICKYSHIEAIK